MGFKSPEEYILFEELRKNDVNVMHNIYLHGMEIDLFVPPKIVIEIGFRDAAMMKKWNYFDSIGFPFLYFSNIEIRDPNALRSCVGKIMKTIQTNNDDSAHEMQASV